MTVPVIGFGNLDRQDDGAAWPVVDAVRRCWGRTPLDGEANGLRGLTGDCDAVFVGQLAPDLLDVAKDYDRLVLVDAHVHGNRDDLHVAPAEPDYHTGVFTHHMTPALFVALLDLLYRRRPEVHAVSIRGECFDSGRELSPGTRAPVERAAERILELAKG